MKLKTLLVTILLTTSLIGVAYAEAITVLVGSKDITLPELKGFTSKNVNSKIVKALNTPVVRVVAAYRPNDKFDISRGRYIIISTPKEIENKGLSASDFLALSKQVKEQNRTLIKSENYNSVLKDMSNSLQKATGLKIKQSINDIIPLGVFLENDRAIGIVNAYTVNETFEGSTTTYKVTNATIIVLLKGKLLTINIYSSFDSMDDINWLKRKAKLWSSQIISLNNGQIKINQRDDPYKNTDNNSAVDYIKELRRIKDLLDSGAINEDEFKVIKKKLIDKL